MHKSPPTFNFLVNGTSKLQNYVGIAKSGMESLFVHLFLTTNLQSL